MKTVYITGAAGFIGQYVTQLCIDKGWYVRTVDKLTPVADSEAFFNMTDCHQINYDIKDINDLDHLYDCDYIINCAAETHVDNSIAGSKVFLKSNVDGVHHLLELIRLKGGYKLPTLLHFSTDEVYGDIVSGSHKETDVLKPSNPYSATKAAADMLIQAWHRTYGIPYLIVRPTNNYGIGQYVEKLIPRAIKCLNLNQKIPLHNNGIPIRTWLHAQDTAEAVVTIIESGVKNTIYNIGGDCEYQNIEVIRFILESYKGVGNFKIEDHVDFSWQRVGQDVRYSLDDSKLRALGWSPKKKLIQEIPKIVMNSKGRFVW